MYQYNWLFEARSIGEFFKRLGIFILIVIIFVLHFIGVSYLIDNIVCLLIPAIILVMIYFKIKIKIRTRDIICKRKNKLCSRIFYSILISLILFFIYSLNKYTIFYENKIKKYIKSYNSNC